MSGIFDINDGQQKTFFENGLALLVVCLFLYFYIVLLSDSKYCLLAHVYFSYFKVSSDVVEQ